MLLDESQSRKRWSCSVAIRFNGAVMRSLCSVALMWFMIRSCCVITSDDRNSERMTVIQEERRRSQSASSSTGKARSKLDLLINRRILRHLLDLDSLLYFYAVTLAFACGEVGSPFQNTDVDFLHLTSRLRMDERSKGQYEVTATRSDPSGNMRREERYYKRSVQVLLMADVRLSMLLGMVGGRITRLCRGDFQVPRFEKSANRRAR